MIQIIFEVIILKQSEWHLKFIYLQPKEIFMMDAK